MQFFCSQIPFLFNLLYRSLSVANECGYKLFSILSVNKIDEIFNSESNADTKIAERLFGSSLVSVVMTREQYKLKVSTKTSFLNISF